MESTESAEVPGLNRPFVLYFEEAGIECELPEGTTRLGRDEENELCAGDPSVSTFHAELTWDGRRLFVHDLQSTNGTERNGERVAEAELSSGDRLKFGELICRVEQVEEPPPLRNRDDDYNEVDTAASASQLIGAEREPRTEQSPEIFARADALRTGSPQPIEEAETEAPISIADAGVRPQLNRGRRTMITGAVAGSLALLAIGLLVHHWRNTSSAANPADGGIEALSGKGMTTDEVRQRFFRAQLAFDLERDPTKQRVLEEDLTGLRAKFGEPPPPSPQQREREETVLHQVENARERISRYSADVVWLTGVVHELRSQGYGQENLRER